MVRWPLQEVATYSDEYINTKKRFGHWKDMGCMIKGAGVRNVYHFLSTDLELSSQ